MKVSSILSLLSNSIIGWRKLVHNEKSNSLVINRQRQNTFLCFIVPPQETWLGVILIVVRNCDVSATTKIFLWKLLMKNLLITEYTTALRSLSLSIKIHFDFKEILWKISSMLECRRILENIRYYTIHSENYLFVSS